MKINQHALKYIFTETLFRQQEGSLQNIETDIKFLGKNNKNILIIAPNHEDVEGFLSKAEIWNRILQVKAGLLNRYEVS